MKVQCKRCKDFISIELLEDGICKDCRVWIALFKDTAARFKKNRENNEVNNGNTF